MSSELIRGRFTQEHLASGATLIRSLDFPEVPEPELRAVADRIAAALAGGDGAT